MGESDHRTVISARVPDPILKELRIQAEATGQSLTDVIVAGLAAYVGRELPQSWGDRLAALEDEVSGLRKKLRGWA